MVFDFPDSRRLISCRGTLHAGNGGPQNDNINESKKIVPRLAVLIPVFGHVRDVALIAAPFERALCRSHGITIPCETNRETLFFVRLDCQA